MKKYLKGLTSGALFLAPFLSFAAIGGIEEVQVAAGEVDIEKIISRILGWTTGIVISIAALFFLFAAITYMTAAGDEEKVKKAKNYIIYAIVGSAGALLAFTLRAILKNILLGEGK